MADSPIQLKPKTTKPPDDALDIDSLWLDPALGDGLVDVHYHDIPVGKPRDFFRVNPDPAYRRLAEIYVHKVEGQIDEQTYIIATPMQGVIEEARRCTLVTAVTATARRGCGRSSCRRTGNAIMRRGSRRDRPPRSPWTSG